MADLASTAVTNVSQDYFGGLNGKQFVHKQVRAQLSTQGTAANKITATSLGLTRIVGCSAVVNEDNDAFYQAVPSYDGSFLILLDAAFAPTDSTELVQFTVWGPSAG